MRAIDEYLNTQSVTSLDPPVVVDIISISFRHKVCWRIQGISFWSLGGIIVILIIIDSASHQHIISATP